MFIEEFLSYGDDKSNSFSLKQHVRLSQLVSFKSSFNYRNFNHGIDDQVEFSTIILGGGMGKRYVMLFLKGEEKEYFLNFSARSGRDDRWDAVSFHNLFENQEYFVSKFFKRIVCYSGSSVLFEMSDGRLFVYYPHLRFVEPFAAATFSHQIGCIGSGVMCSDIIVSSVNSPQNCIDIIHCDTCQKPEQFNISFGDERKGWKTNSIQFLKSLDEGSLVFALIEGNFLLP